jgi:hypothetical protein
MNFLYTGRSRVLVAATAIALNRVPYKADVDIGEIASLQVGTHCEHCHRQRHARCRCATEQHTIMLFITLHSLL